MNALFIALNGLKLSLRRREAVFWIFIGPLIFTTFFGVLFKARPPRAASLTIVNEDRNDLIAKDLATGLQHDGIVVAEARTVTASQPVLVVPLGAADAWGGNRMPELTLHAGPEETTAERDLLFKIVKALIALRLGVNTADPPAPLAIVPIDPGVKPREVTAGFQRAVPSYTIMFVFLNLLVSGVGIAEERRRGMLRRLGIAPITKSEIILGKLLARVMIG